MRILIDNGHGAGTKGKCSPDGRLLEYKWAREIAKRIHAELTRMGCDAELLTPEEEDISIAKRVSRVNAHCRELGSKKMILVSVHVNAADNDGSWRGASGFSVFCSKNASESSKRLARSMTHYALDHDMTGDRSIPKERYWTWNWTDKDIALLRDSHCPAVLTENFFMDNKDDVDYLLSEDGKAEIVKLHVDCIVEYIKNKG